MAYLNQKLRNTRRETVQKILVSLFFTTYKAWWSGIAFLPPKSKILQPSAQNCGPLTWDCSLQGVGGGVRWQCLGWSICPYFHMHNQKPLLGREGCAGQRGGTEHKYFEHFISLRVEIKSEQGTQSGFSFTLYGIWMGKLFFKMLWVRTDEYDFLRGTFDTETNQYYYQINKKKIWN